MFFSHRLSLLKRKEEKRREEKEKERGERRRKLLAMRSNGRSGWTRLSSSEEISEEAEEAGLCFVGQLWVSLMEDRSS